MEADRFALFDDTYLDSQSICSLMLDTECDVSCFVSVPYGRLVFVQDVLIPSCTDRGGTREVAITLVCGQETRGNL